MGTRWRCRKQPSSRSAGCRAHQGAVEMQFGRGFVMAPAPLPLPVSFCLLSLQLCWRDTEAQGSEATFFRRPAGGEAEGWGGQSGFQTWLLSKCFSACSLPSTMLRSGELLLTHCPSSHLSFSLGAWVSLSQAFQPLCTAQPSVLSAPGLGFKEKP